MSFGKWVKQEREARGLSQQRVAVAIGMSVGGLQKLERNPTQEPSLTNALRLVEFFGFGPDKLGEFQSTRVYLNRNALARAS